MYKLKPNIPDFEIVDGPFAGRKYQAGNVYAEIPPQEAQKFITESPPPLSPSEGGQVSPAGGGVGGGKKKKEVNNP